MVVGRTRRISARVATGQCWWWRWAAGGRRGEAAEAVEESRVEERDGGVGGRRRGAQEWVGWMEMVMDESVLEYPRSQ